MNEEQFKIMHSRKGFIAALDQSGGSTPKALQGYGIPSTAYKTEEEMYDLVHQMRTRVIKAKAFSSKKILGAILFEKTMDRKIDNKYTADYLWEVKKVVPFLKIDKGLNDEKDGVRLMKSIFGIDDLLKRAVERHIFGTKERSVVNEADPEGIKALVDQQFELGAKVISYGLVPIIEPEVTISISDKAAAEKMLLADIFADIAKLGKDDKIMIKVSLPSVVGFYDKLAEDPHVVRVVALSGGYSQKEAGIILKKNKGMTASFSRALLEGLTAQQTDAEFESTIGKSIDYIFDASANKE